MFISFECVHFAIVCNLVRNSHRIHQHFVNVVNHYTKYHKKNTIDFSLQFIFHSKKKKKVRFSLGIFLLFSIKRHSNSHINKHRFGYLIGSVQVNTKDIMTLVITHWQNTQTFACAVCTCERECVCVCVCQIQNLSLYGML